MAHKQSVVHVRKNSSDVRLPPMAPKDIPRKKRKLGTVAVAGESMAPTFRAGDWLFVMWGGEFHLGQTVLIERQAQPGVFLIKRVIRMEADKYWVEGDNKEESTDSRQWGALEHSEIVATVVFRFRKAGTGRSRHQRD